MHQLNGTGGPVIGRGAGILEMVHATHHVVVPPRREMEGRPCLVDHVTGSMRQIHLVSKHEFLSAGDGRVCIAAACPSLPFQESFEYRDRRMKRGVGSATEVLTIPSAVAHGSNLQHLRDGVNPGVEHIEVGPALGCPWRIPSLLAAPAT